MNIAEQQRGDRAREAEALIRRAEYVEVASAQLRFGASMLRLAAALETFGAALASAVSADAEVVGEE